MMRISRAMHTKLASYLNKKSLLDGRCLLFLLIALYFLPIFIAATFLYNSEQWKNLWWVFPLVPKMWPSFRDLRVITSGYECYRLGYETRIENPCDPYEPSMPMNYPKIWLSFAHLGINQNHTVLIGIAIGILFLLMLFLVIKRINYAESAIYALILFSPSVMLGMERGNNDLIIFSLLSIMLIIVNRKVKNHRLISGFIIIFSAILKLFPILAIVFFLRERKKVFLITTSLIIALFLLYFFRNLDDIKLISSATLKGAYWSYGWKVIFSLLWQDFRFRKRIVFPVVCGFILFVLGVIWSKLKHPSVIQYEQYSMDAFRVGGTIYIGSFLFIGNNWAYRLIFLIFTIPQIIAWIKNNKQLSIISSFSLIAIIMTMWFKPLGEYGNPNTFEILLTYFSQLIDWSLLFFFIYTLLLTLPIWLKSWITPYKVGQKW